MNKRNIGYVIELDRKNRFFTYAYSAVLCDAVVFPTREEARNSRRRFGGLGRGIIHQVALGYNNRPVSIIKKVK